MLRVMLASGVSPRSAALKLRRNLSAVRSKIRKIQAGDQETARQRSDRARKPDKPSASTGAAPSFFVSGPKRPVARPPNLGATSAPMIAPVMRQDIAGRKITTLRARTTDH